jgi:hypothetical protein
MAEKRLKTRAEHLLCSVPTEYKEKDCKTEATYVCHHCGTPLCKQCAKIVNDPEFVRFDISWNRFVLVPVIIIGSIIIPTILKGMLPEGWSLPIAISGIIIGLSTLATIQIQPKFTPVKKIYQEAAHCKKCMAIHRSQNITDNLLLGSGVFVLAFGLYKFVVGLNAYFLVLASLGVVIMLLKEDIAYRKS